MTGIRYAALGIIILFSSSARAAEPTYTLSTNYNIESDADYKYFSSAADRRVYTCGPYVDNYPSSYQYTSLKHGDTIYYNSSMYYCCNNNEGKGYWARYDYVRTLPTFVCETKYNWVAVGMMGYCQATQAATVNRCKNYSAGIFNGNTGWGCDYNNGYCSIVTHCGAGKYMNNGRCVNCPNGGTTNGYTNGGITDCYLPSGASSQDTTGTYRPASDCPYVE